MSEKACSSCGRHASPQFCLVCAKTELAAAEERGRRRGVEERDELRAALIASRPFVADHYKQHALGINAKYHLDLLNRIDATLAPRDSGKEG